MGLVSALVVTVALGAVFHTDKGRTQDLVPALPSDAVTLSHQGQTYYFSNGYFYRKEQRYFLPVEAPLGATVPRLPSQGTFFSIDDKRYFLSGTGTFFLYSATRRTYTVASPPYNWRNYYRDPLAPEITVYPRAFPPVRTRSDTGDRDSETLRAPYWEDRVDRESYCRFIATDAGRRTRSAGREDRRRLDLHRSNRLVYRRCLREYRRDRNN
ncbi:DUF6515 family protein [Microbulbifer sp. 2201CG32-9]|uniref:DUF6515 family protein n=1 Tax=Microbulbifer sp. 2201CG32-9 TaxID=3232309 RepID=UPI00345BDE02